MIDFDSLTEEQMLTLRNKYVKLFDRVRDVLKDRKSFFDERMSNKEKTLSNLKLTPLGKVALIAKKFFLNSVISHTTGIDPMFLDSDTSFLRQTEEQKMHYYYECNIKSLMYLVVNDLYNGVEELINKLKTNDKDELKKIIKIVDDNEKTVVSLEQQRNISFDQSMLNSSYVDEGLSYESMLYPLLINMEILDKDKYNRAYVMAKRGYKLEVPINFIAEIYDINNNYNQEKKVK